MRAPEGFDGSFGGFSKESLKFREHHFELCERKRCVLAAHYGPGHKE